MDPFESFKAAQKAGWAHFAPLEMFTTAVAAKLVKHAKVHPGQRVLDVCCGTGVVAVTAARVGARVISQVPFGVVVLPGPLRRICGHVRAHLLTRPCCGGHLRPGCCPLSRTGLRARSGTCRLGRAGGRRQPWPSRSLRCWASPLLGTSRRQCAVGGWPYFNVWPSTYGAARRSRQPV